MYRVEASQGCILDYFFSRRLEGLGQISLGSPRFREVCSFVFSSHRLLESVEVPELQLDPH